MANCDKTGQTGPWVTSGILAKVLGVFELKTGINFVLCALGAQAALIVLLDAYLDLRRIANLPIQESLPADAFHQLATKAQSDAFIGEISICVLTLCVTGLVFAAIRVRRFARQHRS